MRQVQCNWKARPKLRINKSLSLSILIIDSTFTLFVRLFVCLPVSPNVPQSRQYLVLAHLIRLRDITESRKDHQKYISFSVSFKRTSCTRHQQNHLTLAHENRKSFLILGFCLQNESKRRLWMHREMCANGNGSDNDAQFIKEIKAQHKKLN